MKKAIREHVAKRLPVLLQHQISFLIDLGDGRVTFYRQTTLDEALQSKFTGITDQMPRIQTTVQAPIIQAVLKSF